MSDFEKMDQEWMRKLEGARERKVPDSVRAGFRKSVEDRIFKAGRGFSFAFAPALVPLVILGAGIALSWFYLRPQQPLVPVQVEDRIQQPQARTAVISNEQNRTFKPAPPTQQSGFQAVTEKAAAPVPAALTPELTESNIVEEIEMLKELGVWTEDDETEIGVSADQIFEELETMAGEISQAASMPAEVQPVR